jgi:hypothetical protein
MAPELARTSDYYQKKDDRAWDEIERIITKGEEWAPGNGSRGFLRMQAQKDKAAELTEEKGKRVTAANKSRFQIPRR